MAQQLSIRRAIKAIINGVAPYAKVIGFDQDASRPARGEPGGLILGEMGDAGEPDVTLSPLTYHIDQPFLVQLMAPDSMSAADASEWLAVTASAIGCAIEGDRTLGGLADWIDSGPMVEESATPTNSATQRWGVIEIRVAYATANPLT